jgi:transposase
MTPSSRKPGRRSALERHGLVNPGAESVQDKRFRDSDFFDPLDLVQVRYEMLRSATTGEQTATDAATTFGISRAAYYQIHAAFDREGIVGLIPRKRGPRGAHKLTAEVIDFVQGQLHNNPRLGSADLARLVRQQFQLKVHPRSVERALQRRKKKRLPTR